MTQRPRLLLASAPKGHCLNAAASSLVTPRWRKADSNPWPPLHRRRLTRRWSKRESNSRSHLRGRAQFFAQNKADLAPGGLERNGVSPFAMASSHSAKVELDNRYLADKAVEHRDLGKSGHHPLPHVILFHHGRSDEHLLSPALLFGQLPYPVPIRREGRPKRGMRAPGAGCRIARCRNRTAR